METKKPYDGDGAFPYAPTGDGVGQPFPHQGMSLRDWFAGQAMAGMHASIQTPAYSGSNIAEAAYRQADAMLKARGSNV